LYVVTDITNSDTKELGRAAYEKETIGDVPLFKEAKEWPSEDDRAKALIGSPNGIAGPYMFLDHFDELGRKTIASVKFWRAVPATANLLMTLRDVEENSK
jgi:hypothetical protein